MRFLILQFHLVIFEFPPGAKHGETSEDKIGLENTTKYYDKHVTESKNC